MKKGMGVRTRDLRHRVSPYFRVPILIPFLGFAAGLLVVSSVLTGHILPATESAAQESGGSDVGELGGTTPDGVPDLGPPRPVPSEIRERLTALRAYRDRVRSARRPRPARVRIPSSQRPDLVPPRMDSGDPDPDRLLPSSRPAIPEFAVSQ